MNLPQVEVYAFNTLGRKSYSAYYRLDGRKVVLKPKKDFLDNQVLRYLFEIKMQGIPYILGETSYQSNTYLVFSWIDGNRIDQVELSPAEINQALTNILQLIQKMKIITGLNWFFLDLKPQHILIDPTGLISLVDFEHVTVSKLNQIPWQDLKQIGLTPKFCSNEIMGTYLTKNHQEYALALVYISLLAGKPLENIKISDRKKALRKISKEIALKIESALNGNGFMPEQQNKTNIKELNSLTKISEPETSEPEPVFKDNSVKSDFRQSTIADQTVIPREHSLTIFEKTNNEIIQTQELRVITKYKFVSFCKCHTLPMICVLDLAYLIKDNLEEKTSQIIEEIDQLSEEGQMPELLTKNMAQHIVKQCAITDLFLSGKHLSICKVLSDQDLSLKWQIQEVKYGEFTANSELNQTVSNYICYEKR